MPSTNSDDKDDRNSDLGGGSTENARDTAVVSLTYKKTFNGRMFQCDIEVHTVTAATHQIRGKKLWISCGLFALALTRDLEFHNGLGMSTERKEGRFNIKRFELEVVRFTTSVGKMCRRVSLDKRQILSLKSEPL